MAPAPRHLLVAAGGVAVLVAAGAVFVYLGAPSDPAEALSPPSPEPTASTASAASEQERLAALLPALPELPEGAAWEDPETVELPPPAGPDDVGVWARTDGVPALTLATASQQLWLLGDDACDDVTAALEAAGSAEEILDSAASAPDPTTRDLLAGLDTITRSALRETCAPAGPSPDSDATLAELAWQWTVTRRQLQASGVDLPS